MHKGRLYVADIGDNGADRERITVYYFDDAQANDQTAAYRSWEFRYPDGAHDAETLLVNDDGRLYIVTKGAFGAVYAAPKSPKRTAVNELVRVGDAPTAVTDGTFLPGGNRIALLTAFGTIEILDADSYEKVGTTTAPAQRQPESITVSLTGKSLLVGSEGEESAVYAVPIPEGSSTATPSATPSDSGERADPVDRGGGRVDDRAGPSADPAGSRPGRAGRHHRRRRGRPGPEALGGEGSAMVDSAVRVMTWNIWWRFGPRWTDRQPGLLATLERVRPDVVALQEVWGSSETTQADELADALEMHAVFAAPSYPVAPQDPDRADWTGITLGIALLSRGPSWTIVRSSCRPGTAAGTRSR